MMKMWIIQLSIVSLFLLFGCQEELSNSPKLTHEVEANRQVEEIGNSVSHSEVNVINEHIFRPVVVTVTDPRTLEILTMISPLELGYETDPSLYKTKIQKLAKELARGTNTAIGYDQSMVLDRLGDNGQIIKGNPGQILKERELVDKILAISEEGGNVDLPLYALESNYERAELPALSDVTVATYTTYFNAAEVGRSKNIELSANALHNTIVGVGDYFSFNTMVGERTKERGYQSAPEIINKKRVIGIGGGICQTSSTLFNAVDEIGVKMTERHHHSLSVGYVPTGRDATVSYGTLDFKFQNSSGVPFLIKTFYSPGVLKVEITTAQHYEELLKNF